MWLSKETTMSDNEGCPGTDTVCPLGPPGEDGAIRVVRHTHDHGYEMGTLRPLEEGKPIHGELVQVEGDGLWRKVKPILRKSGPSMINSKEYREGWTTIFGHQTYGDA
jgi:hypothetical protein